MTNKTQLFGLFICTQSALHVSGEVFAHHQEHLTVFTTSDIVHLCCCRPVSWTRWNEFRLVHDTGQQQYRWTISETVNTVKCSWWWAKTSPETCRDDWVQLNKPKICIFLVINYALDSRLVTSLTTSVLTIALCKVQVSGLRINSQQSLPANVLLTFLLNAKA
jgi:hypothetical protein